MTISTSVNRYPYAGNGVTTAFAYGSRFLANADIVVLLVDDATGVPTTQILTTNYTMTGAGDAGGGTITMLVAPPTGTTLVIYGDPEIKQAIDFVENDALPAETIETAYDRLTLICARLKDQVSRALKLADSDTTTSPVLPTPTASSGLGWNAAGTALINYVLQTGTSLVDLAASAGSSLVGFIQSGTGAVATTVDNVLNSIPGGVGDYSIDNQLMIMVGDSTTQIMGGNGYGSDYITLNRAAGGRWEKLAGLINFGGSGVKFTDFLSYPAVTPPSVSTSNLGVGNFDYYGHTPGTIVGLQTVLNWRSGKSDKATWLVCFGINDVQNNSVIGNLSQSEITAYITSQLNELVTTISSSYPKDKIILRVPNPMTARPWTGAFPSPSQYPSYGSNLTDDRALIEKWNQALRNGYIATSNLFPGTVLFDTWGLIFGPSNVTLQASTELPFLNDMIHPNGYGYVAIAEALMTLLSGNPVGSHVRRVEAATRATLLSNSAWENYPGYFRNNPDYQLMSDTDQLGSALISIGASHIDLPISYTHLMSRIDISKSIYVSIGNVAAQEFATGYVLTAIGSNTRMTGITVSAAMQTAPSNALVDVYQKTTFLIANDSYVTSQIKSLNPRFYSTGVVVGGGAGYLDITFDAAIDRISTKFIDGVYNSTLVVGGAIQTSFSLSTASNIAKIGTPSQRAVRVSIAGTYTTYTGVSCAIIFDDSAPTPLAYETLVISGTTHATPGTQTTHAHGLGYTPKRTNILPTSNGVIYQSAVPDATNIYIKGSAAGLTFDAYVK